VRLFSRKFSWKNNWNIKAITEPLVDPLVYSAACCAQSGGSARRLSLTRPENLFDRLDILLIRNMAHVVLKGFTNISIYSIYNRLEVTA